MEQTMRQSHILIVEDEKSLRQALIAKLESSFPDYHICGSDNAKDAVRLSLDHHPAIIILDVLLPGKDGISFLETLRSNEIGKNIPVIILSNVSDPDKISNAMKHNVFHYHIKSDTPLDSIVSIVQEQLG